MTFASALFGSDLPYVSGDIYPLSNLSVVTNSSSPNADILVPFSPRATVQIDGVAWFRDQASAANVYVGVYGADGALLTDCAVDSVTDIGMHSVPTSPVSLNKGLKYYFCWNSSADVIRMLGNVSGVDNRALWLERSGVSSSLAADSDMATTVAYAKARTNAALLSSLTMSGFIAQVAQPSMGFKAA